MFDCSQSEVQAIDSALEPKLAWALDRRDVTEQMALDASRLLSCVDKRVADYVDQGFFKRCWFGLTGKNGKIERANQKDLIEMQKYAWRYISLLQERDLLLAHSMIVVKNNLLTLSVEQDEVRKEICRLADKVYDRFVALEDRVGDLEISRNIHGWLLTLDTRDYDQRYPDNLRLLRVVADFYSMKSDSWNVMELKYLQKALKEVGLDPKSTISISGFVNAVIDEIESSGYSTFAKLMTPEKEKEPDNDFIIESISAPAFSSLYQIKHNYTNSSRIIKSIQKKMSISHDDAIKMVLHDFIEERGIDTSAEVPIKDLATEILSCLSLAHRLSPAEEIKEQFVGVEERTVEAASANNFYLNSERTRNDDIPSDQGISQSPQSSTDYDISEEYEYIRKKTYELIESGVKIRNLNIFEDDISEEFGDISSQVIDKFRKNAECGQDDSEFIFGILHCLGIGVEKNYKDAHKWLEKAAESGIEISKLVLISLIIRTNEFCDQASAYYWGIIPQSKLRNANASFITKTDKIFLLIDTTIFGSCSDGVALGLKGLYWKTYSDKNFLSWGDVFSHWDSVSCKKDDVVLWSEDKITLVGSYMTANTFDKLIVTLRDMRRFLECGNY